MQKTKLGLTVGLMGAILYLLGLFGGYFVAIAAAAYVLIREEDTGLRRNAVKMVVLMLAFPVLNTIIGVIPDLVELLNKVMGLFDEYLDLQIVTDLIGIIKHIISMVEYVVFILMAFFSLLGKTINVPFIDKHVD